jgi:hypothetical protein
MCRLVAGRYEVMAGVGGDALTAAEPFSGLALTALWAS